MATIPIVIKHAGKKYDVEVDTSATGETLKYQVYSLTGVEPERQKILMKKGALKDDTELSSLGLKPKQEVMMMGTPSGAGSVVEKPKEKIRFLEDMTEAEQAQSEGAIPVGLQNLGNTCYLNSTLQTLRAIPELQQELQQYSESASGASSSSLSNLSQFGLGGLGSSTDLTASLRDLYKQMSETTQEFPPMMFLNALRSAFPQFAQKAKDGRGYAQQDAEEVWSQIVTQLRQKLKLKDIGSTGESAAQKAADLSFVDKYLAGRTESVMECDEQAAKDGGEEPIRSEDVFLKLDCHISAEINHLREGLMAALTEKIEKNSPVLERNAMYTKTSRLSRLPKYATVHFVRFFWRRDTNKKAKIMRKVTFPQELDIIEFCTEDLKSKLIPIRDKIREIRKEELDVERAKKRQRLMRRGEENDTGAVVKATGPADQEKLAADKSANQKKTTAKGADVEMEDVSYKTDAEIEAEKAATILAAKKELLGLVDAQLKQDEGANQTGLYELRGVITHQGSSADSGHYTSYVKKSARKDPVTGKMGEEDGKWWWFNDAKVTEVDAEKIDTLSGGGESHSALILLYRAVELPTIEENTTTAAASSSSS